MGAAAKSSTGGWAQQVLSFSTMFSFVLLAGWLQQSDERARAAEAVAAEQAAADEELLLSLLEQRSGNTWLVAAVEELSDARGPGLVSSPKEVLAVADVPATEVSAAVAAVEVDAHSGGS